ncbi:MEKHLA domain-containing protein [Ktedonosporobacter rubrisoli]|uniref:histidine kinase n=1 Tax=Ktedonosporobacter rubrisoli TaxID=2509675 RepID=A0A4P6JNT4_KTERU|nr:PAS domain S-box protein [Ktedonosporobacter rubrisoli]QBD76396.1 MEKHLA domain-containing protein [Ktedonosporobacter rubrisoli]
MTKIEPRLLSIQKAAAFLGVDANTIRNWARSGLLEGVKVGRRGDWRFSQESLLAMTQTAELRSPGHTAQFHLAAIIESSDDAIISINLAGIITIWNRAAEKIFGYTVQEALGQPINLIIPEELHNEEQELLLKIKQGNCIEHYETVRRKKTGEKLVVSLTLSPIKDEIGTIIGVSKIVRNISRRNRDMEAQLYLAAIVASSDDAIVSKNLNGIVTSWNKGAERIFGYTEEEAIGKEIKTLIIPKDRWQEEDNILRTLKQGIRIDHFETERVRKDGKSIMASVTISPIKDGEGNIIGASKVARDITEKKQMENEIAYLASLVEANADAIWGMALDGTISSWNKGAEKLYGYTAEEMIGKPLTVLVPSDKVQELSSLGQIIARGQQVVNHETQRLTRENRRIDVSVSMAPVKASNGTITGISLTARDITALKQLEKNKDEFIGAASHELKTPLTSQKMFLQLLQREVAQLPNSKMEQYVVRILKQNERMNQLVNEMLTIARLEAGQLQLKKAPCLLIDCVKEVLNELALAFPTHQVIVEGTHSRAVTIDKKRISEVITNLLMNAVKYSPKANRIVVSLSEDAARVTLSVQDFGIGIAKADQKRIFEKFFRVSGESEQTYPGFGMGLYIASEIVAQHQGKLWVESTLGKGTTFHLSLPA